MTALNLSQINQLKQQLSLFEAPVGHAKTSPLLQSYLDFYKLPTASDQLMVSVGTITVGQNSLFAAAWQPPEPVGTALVVHGYMDHLGLYSHLIHFLLAQNLAVVCCDLPGHGLSDGESGYIKDFADYRDVVAEMASICQQKFPAPLHGLGQSMGGAILLKHLINQPPSVDYCFKSLNLFAPLLHPKAWSTSRRIFPLIKPFKKSIKRVFRPSSYDQDFLDFLRYRDPLQPLSIPIAWLVAVEGWVREFEASAGSDFAVNLIQGDADKTLDWEYNLEGFKSKLPNLSLSIINRANHHMVNEIQTLRSEIFAAIKL